MLSEPQPIVLFEDVIGNALIFETFFRASPSIPENIQGNYMSQISKALLWASM
jgi:hypothetical protein